MDASDKLDWSLLEELLPICKKYIGTLTNGERIDVSQVAEDLGGNPKIKAAVQKAINEKLEQGLEDGLGLMGKDLASVLESMEHEVIGSVVSYLKSGDANELFNCLDTVLQNNTGKLQGQLVQLLDIPEDEVDFINKAFGGYALTVYLFYAVYKMYKKAADDAELARQHRVEVEQNVQAAIAELQESRARMDEFMSEYMLDRLLPFETAVAAMDEAMLQDDDDGYIRANAELWKLFGRRAQYANKEEFDALMTSDKPFAL